MKVSYIRSDEVYAKIADAPSDKKNDIYRYEIALPFKGKWDCYNIPMKPAKPGGYDVIMASAMLGHLPPTQIDDSQKESIRLISSDALWEECEKSVRNALRLFTEQGIELPVQDYLFTLIMADPESPYISLSDGYCGDGGIPGYITAALTPNDYTVSRMPMALTHEVDHNVRYQFIKWRNDVNLGEMLVSEGLAENLATFVYGEEKAGPWVTKTELEWLNEYIKPIIRGGLGVQGLSELNAYLYGDEMAAVQGCAPVGLPYCAGYACGYHLVRHYLRKTGKSVVEATLLPAEEILSQAEDFWETETKW